MKVFNTISYLILVCIGCFYSGSKSGAPERATGIPDTAFWVGGADGGNWYIIDSFNQNKSEADIKIYNDFTGELIASKTFKMDCLNAGGINWNNLQRHISGFDGKRILLEIKGPGNSGRYCYFE